MMVQNFIKEWQGKKIGNGECVTLCQQWQTENGWPVIHANAIDWQKFGGWNGYKWVPNHVWVVPKPGDVAVFYIPGSIYGHVAVVSNGATIRTMTCFHQNWPHANETDPATTRVFDYVHPKCLGFIRR